MLSFMHSDIYMRERMAELQHEAETERLIRKSRATLNGLNSHRQILSNLSTRITGLERFLQNAGRSPNTVESHTTK